MGSAWILVAKFNSMLTWSPGGWPLEAAVLPRFTLSGSYRARFQVRAVLLCQYPSQVSYLPCSFRGPPSGQGQGPAPLVEAPRTPLSDHLHSVMSQSLADITSTAQAQSKGESGAGTVVSSLGCGPS